MERDLIDMLIDKYTHMITIELVKKIRKTSIIIYVLLVCFLLPIKSFILIGILIALIIVEFAYLTTILKKNLLTLYSGIGVSLVLFGNVVILFNVSLYSVQRLIGCFDFILLMVILAIEVLCLMAGFFYTRRCIRNSTVRKPKAAVPVSMAVVLPSTLGYFLTRYVINETSVLLQNVFFTIVFTLISSIIMFTIGMAQVAILYFIKKYDIPNRTISH